MATWLAETCGWSFCIETNLINFVFFYFKTCTVRLLLFCTMTNKCTIISQIIPLLHVSTRHSHGTCNQYLAKLHNKCTIISQVFPLLHVSTLSCYPQGACNQYLVKLHNKCTIISQIFPLLHVSTQSLILRELVINTLPSYTSISNAAVGNTIYN